MRPTHDRLRRAVGSGLSLDQRALRARIIESRSSDLAMILPDGRDELLGGPFGPMLLAPQLGDAVQELGKRLRFKGTLADDVREMVTLCAAGHRRSTFELAVHRGLAVAAGVPDDVIEALCSGEPPTGLAGAAQHAVGVASCVVRGRRVDDDLFADALAALGPDGLFQVTVICGYYNLLADVLDVFEVPTPVSS